MGEVNDSWELSLRKIAAEMPIDWQARCLAAEAELATVKAALPKWRKDGLAFKLSVGPYDRWVEPVGNGMWRAPYIGTTRYSRADAMTAVTEALGLPPCEVCDA
jgi:hypothetical protein